VGAGGPHLTTLELFVNRTISMTMRRALDLIGIHDPAQLAAEAAGLAETHPLRRVDELLTRCLYDIDNAERVMRTQLEALKQSANREIGHLDQGYATGDWPVHYADKAETGRRNLERAFEQVNILADLRRLLHTHTNSLSGTPPDRQPRAEAGT
jgi:hypothetical protein